MCKKVHFSRAKYVFLCLLSAILCLCLAACDTQPPISPGADSQPDARANTESAVIHADNTANRDENGGNGASLDSGDCGDSLLTESTSPEQSEANTPNEESDPVSDSESGIGKQSLQTAYEAALALHEQDPDTYRNPGELQRETKEMIQLEDGQWYQSFVYSSYNLRCIFLSNKEAGGSDGAQWDFWEIGSEKNAFLFNVGVLYDDPSGLATYREHPIAVRGTLADGSDGYAYQLLLPDMLTVCVEIPATEDRGSCDFFATETLAIPEAYASLFNGMTGEVIVTGVVMRDENGVLYLKDVALLA